MPFKVRLHLLLLCKMNLVISSNPHDSRFYARANDFHKQIDHQVQDSHANPIYFLNAYYRPYCEQFIICFIFKRFFVLVTYAGFLQSFILFKPYPTSSRSSLCFLFLIIRMCVTIRNKRSVPTSISFQHLCADGNVNNGGFFQRTNVVSNKLSKWANGL